MHTFFRAIACILMLSGVIFLSLLASSVFNADIASSLGGVVTAVSDALSFPEVE